MSNEDQRDDHIFREVRGGRSSQDPLEELISRFREYFEKFFKEGGRGGGRPPVPGKAIAYGLFIFLAVVGILTSVYTVDVSEEGVVTRFQRYHTTSSPGLHFKFPFFIDRVTKVPSKVI
jgi:membrane protease subunit HflK